MNVVHYNPLLSELEKIENLNFLEKKTHTLTMSTELSTIPQIVKESIPGRRLELHELPPDDQARLSKISEAERNAFIEMLPDPRRALPVALTDAVSGPMSWSSKCKYENNSFVIKKLKLVLKPCTWHHNYRDHLTRYTVIADDDECYDQCHVEEATNTAINKAMIAERVVKTLDFELKFQAGYEAMGFFMQRLEEYLQLRNQLDAIESFRSENNEAIVSLGHSLKEAQAVLEAKEREVAEHIERNLTDSKYRDYASQQRSSRVMPKQQWIDTSLASSSYNLEPYQRKVTTLQNSLAQAKATVAEKVHSIREQKPVCDSKLKAVTEAAHIPYYYFRRSLELITDLEAINPISFVERRGKVHEELNKVIKFIPEDSRERIYNEQQRIQSANSSAPIVIALPRLGTKTMLACEPDCGLPHRHNAFVDVTQDMIDREVKAREIQIEEIQARRERQRAEAAEAAARRLADGIPEPEEMANPLLRSEPTTTLADFLVDDDDDVGPDGYHEADARFNRSVYAKKQEILRVPMVGHRPRR